MNPTQLKEETVLLEKVNNNVEFAGQVEASEVTAGGAPILATLGTVLATAAAVDAVKAITARTCMH